MYRLAARSVRARATAFTACGVAVFLGATLILAFLTLLTTGLASGVSSDDRSTLTTMAGVVGGWGLVIVIFAVVSTMQLAVRQRAEEFALLRTIGTTQKQVRRIVLGESLLVGGMASVLALLPGWLLGRVVLSLLRNGNLVSANVRQHAGIAPFAITVVAMLFAAGCAARFAARPALAGSATAALTASRVGVTRMTRRRLWLGIGLVGLGANYSVMAMTMGNDSGDKFAAMSMAGPASVFWSIGLAVFSPVLLQGAARVGGALVGRSAAGQLATIAMRRRAFELSGALMPVIVLVGISTGTLYMVGIDAAAGQLAAHDVATNSVELLNLVVVGMVCVFAAIMVVNTLVATIAARRREFGLQRLAGSTREQVTSMAGIEAALIAATGIVVGGVASLGAVIPYTVVKTSGFLPTTWPWLFPMVAVVAATVTVTTATVASRRAVRTPAVEAVAA
ncbi:MAG TPA: FtsX-like permease family protein [Jatrophihabitantaceae bacterium]|jgi:putative ABC transport system permease protein